MYFLLDLSHYVKSCGHFVKFWHFYDAHSPSMVISRDLRSKFRFFFYFVLQVEKLSTSEVISQNPHRGWKTLPPSPVLLGLTKKFPNVSTSEKKQNFDNFNGFCSQEFDRFRTDLAIFLLKCNEQHSSIPKSQTKTLAAFS